jgi:cyclopropane-fatty-acyl-phospholipid synthase
MFEAVGLDHYDEFFATWERLLEPGASVLMQTITMNEKQFPGYQKSPDWIQKYIFPGGELSSVVEIQKSLARTGSYQLMDLSEMGTHYAWTLREWRRRFHHRIEAVRQLGFDARFERMWDYYLGYCEGAFLERYIGVSQLLLVHSKARIGVHGEPWAKLGSARAGGMYSEG